VASAPREGGHGGGPELREGSVGNIPRGRPAGALPSPSPVAAPTPSPPPLRQRLACLPHHQQQHGCIAVPSPGSCSSPTAPCVRSASEERQEVGGDCGELLQGSPEVIVID